MNQKLLSRYQIEYPIFKVLAFYRYRKVGIPTVFDELLMSLAVEFPELKDNSLNDILKKVKLDEIFIRYTLKNLLDTGLIEHHYFNEDLNNVRLSELVLTENGKKFYYEKKMPGKLKREETYFYFNPLSMEVINSVYEKNQKSDFQLNESLFSFNDETLQNLSLDQMKNFSWVTADVELEVNGISTQVDNNGTKWQEVNIQLYLDQNRNLTLECHDTLFKQWLNSRNSTFCWKNLLSPLLERSRNALSSQEKLDNNLLSNEDLVDFTLADKNISFNKSKYSMLMLEVIINNQKLISSTSPLIILSKSHEEAVLTGQTLFVPNEFDLPENIIQIFVSIEDDQFFAEYDGYLPAYFEHQDIQLPIKYAMKWNKKLSDIDAFKKPNLDTLAFLAKFKTKQDILQKLPRMRIQQAVEFSQKITDTWEEKFAPLQWSEKIEPLNTEEELTQFIKLFELLPEFIHLDINLQNTQIDLALKNPKSKAANFIKLKDLVELNNKLEEFNDEKLQLKLVNAENLRRLEEWEKIIIDFKYNHSDELTKRNKKFISCKEKISALFKPIKENEKFAVLDTNYIINHSNKLDEIKSNRRLILPGMVLQELDKLKNDQQKELLNFDRDIGEKENELKTVQNEVDKIKDNTNIESLDENKEINTKEKLEKIIKNIKKELEKIKNNRKEVDKKAFKIREAARQLDKLPFDRVSVNEGILKMLVKPEDAVADDIILAVACAYKLNDIIFYTGDNILKAKANSIGIKTYS